MILVLVESPVKAKTIKKFLGKDYSVIASMGHVRDLPKRELGVDVEHEFEPKYIIPTRAKKTVSALKKESEKAKEVILATDEDREGESISWHIAQVLKLDNPKRIVFHEITKSAIDEALKNPRAIDSNLVDAQQARRILDRIVGYKLSPFLWKKVARGLSAGRVQSVAVRLIVDREREIEKFKPEEYWSLEAILEKGTQFSAFLKEELKSKDQTDKVVKDLENEKYIVSKVEKKETKKNPLPPFTTSTLQQEAWKRYKFPAKMTMSLAQELYEKGYITYHRTDSLNLSAQSVFQAKDFITQHYGENYYAGYVRKYKSKGRAQEAHEAIRPTDPFKDPLSGAMVKEDKKALSRTSAIKLYDMIWRRFIATQMASALFNSVSADIKAGEHLFRATGQTLKFDGFLKVYRAKFEEKEIPDLEENDELKLIKLNPEQHFTQPPPRYTEASLIKALEENGIGRPSTYAPILSTIQERNYVEKDDQRRFFPAEIGITVNDLLVANFPEIFDIKFTAEMEKDLNNVADGEKKWVEVCKEFYDPFEKTLEKKYKDVSKKDITEKPTGKICPKCGAPLIERIGRFGRFYACSKFPECKHTESLEKNILGVKCPKCEKGTLTAKRTKTGKVFYGCDQFPKCDFALWDRPTGEKCPKCGSLLVESKKRRTGALAEDDVKMPVKCCNKECDYKSK